MTDISVPAAPVASDEVPFEQRYQELLPEMQALTLEELLPVNLEITSAVATVLGALPEILRFVPEMQKLDSFASETVKKLESYAMALSHAQTQYLMASQPQDSLQLLVDEGTALRERLLGDANALVGRSLLNGARLKDLRGPKGFKNLAVDLQILAALFRESLAELQGKWGGQQAELVRADQLAAGILRAVGLREQGTALIAATSDMRTRAFTLLMNAYSEARRGISFLRWEQGDADSIAPSLFAGRAPRRKGEGDIPKPGVPVPSTPSTEPTLPGIGATGATHVPAGEVIAKPPAGTPGADPFLS